MCHRFCVRGEEICYTVEMARYHKIVSPYLLWFFVAVGILVIFTYTGLEYPIFMTNPHPVLYIIAGALFTYWLYFFMKGIGSNMQASFRPHHIIKLVTTGVYSKIRHPIYSADIAFALGVFCLYPTLNIFLSIIWVIIMLFIWIFLEEKSLTDIFKHEYSEYMKKVPMLFPKLPPLPKFRE